ncbi:Ig-like domain-containing protein [Oligosphaera ethanolica]|uniref:Tandem-95 repeat protein n=1 Tax=Oligosphaera ethanolica TaxID=760260 RepID=A0AAE3VGS8_9BACT|nr:Ig-like domain-containing protein [Oligosphaera ethanolica]MDQ0290100.1 hypothetical protein [Oligosphaera ethanolica]
MSSIIITKTIKPLLVCFCSLFLLGTLSAQVATQVFDIRFTYPRACVLGTANAKGMLEINVNTGADINMQNITLLITLPAGVSIPDTAADVTLNPSVIEATSLTKSTKTITADGKLRIYIPGQPTAPAVLKSSADQLLATVLFTMDATLAGTTVNMAFTVQALVGNDGTYTITKDNYLDEAPAAVSIPVFTQRVADNGDIFIRKGAETSKVYTLTSTGGDASKPVTYAITTQPTKGTVEIVGDQATYTVTDTETEFYDDAADTFQFTATDETTGTSAPATVTVSYRANPPAVITALDGQPALGSTLTVPEVDGNGDASSFTLGINATDDPSVTPDRIKEIVWSVAYGDESNAWTIVGQDAPYDPMHPSQDSTITLTLPGYDTITGSPRPADKDFTVTVTVTDALDATSTATWTVKVTDVDRPQGAPQSIDSFTPTAPVTGDDITVNYTGAAAADPDGDAITYRVNWNSGAKFFAGETLTSDNTLKGETWTASVVSVTAPYGADVASAPVTDTVTIGNTAPVVTDGSMFIRKGAETEKTFTLTATDADPADAFTYAIVTAPTKGTVVLADNVVTYTVTDPTQEFYGANADTFTFTANDGTDDSTEATVTVTYRENPPADIVAMDGQPALASVVEVDEVDTDGNPSVFTLGINATDSDIVVPFGVRKIAWAVTGADWTISAPSTDYTDVPTQDNTVSITLPGYETIAGAGRPENQDFTVTVTVWDAMDVESSATWTIRVNDVDRPASAPTTLEILVDGAAIAEGGEAMVAQAITLNADGAVDPDGDVVTGYDFAWANDKTDATDIAARAKGETWTVTAKAKTTVYGAEVISTENSTTSVVIVNTPPVLALVAPLPWTGATALLEDCATTTLPLLDFVAPADDDVADLEAGRSYTVAFTQTDDGSLTYDPTQKTVAFTPALDFYGDVTFTVTANDGTADSAPVNVTFTVLPVNDAPVVAVTDFYAIPDDCTGLPADLIFNVLMGGGADPEDAQSLIAASVVSFTDADGILAAQPTIAFAGHTVTVTYTLLETAKDKMGSEAVITFTVQDDGGVANGGVDTSAVTELKIVLGATPWYPLYELTDAKLAENPAFATYTSYVVRIKDGNTVLAQNTLKDGDRVFTPAKYFTSDVACAGLLPSATAGENKQYTVEIHPRDKNGVKEDIVLQDTVLVPFYAAPTAAEFTNVDAAGVITPAGNTVTFDINAPLASTYTLKVSSVLLGAASKKLVFERNNVKFQPRADGMIIPVATAKGEFLTPGEYIADLSSANPAGASAAVLASATFTIAAAGQTTGPDWGDLFVPPNYRPALSEIIPANGTQVNPQFRWPDIGADRYKLFVTDATGKAVVNGVVVKGTSYNGSSLAAGATYSWWVVAVAAIDADGKEKEVRSTSVSFAIMSQAGVPVVDSVTANGTKLTLNILEDYLPDTEKKFYFDLEYISIRLGKFLYVKKALGNNTSIPVKSGKTSYTTVDIKDKGIPVLTAKGDYVLIAVLDENGNILADYVLYEVK